ncbi:MAG: hypothetical protein K2Y02_02855 [Burkholderiaceae bacterium]|nr:hypothetical protein [Burkholderiaceae bacterium]
MTRLDAADFVDSAAQDRALAPAVAEHKSIFFAESTPDGTPIDHRAAVTGGLMLAPSSDTRNALADRVNGHRARIDLTRRPALGRPFLAVKSQDVLA